MDTLSDNALMLAVKKGENHKLGLLYERYKTRLFGYFYQLTKNVSISEDLVQNVFVRVLKYKSSYTYESTFVTWVFKIARNVFNDNYKQQKRNLGKNIDEVSYKIETIESAENNIELDESKKRLHWVLQQLPNDKREVLILSKLKELRYREVGEIIGCSEGTARTKVHRAMQELKAMYLSLEKKI